MDAVQLGEEIRSLAVSQKLLAEQQVGELEDAADELSQLDVDWPMGAPAGQVEHLSQKIRKLGESVNTTRRRAATLERGALPYAEDDNADPEWCRTVAQLLPHAFRHGRVMGTNGRRLSSQG
jgi:hypothetical protein